MRCQSHEAPFFWIVSGISLLCKELITIHTKTTGKVNFSLGQDFLCFRTNQKNLSVSYGHFSPQICCYVAKCWLDQLKRMLSGVFCGLKLNQQQKIGDKQASNLKCKGQKHFAPVDLTSTSFENVLLSALLLPWWLPTETPPQNHSWKEFDHCSYCE